MQLSFPFLNRKARNGTKKTSSEIFYADEEEISVHFRKNSRARNYLIYVRSDRSLTVTIPRRGTKAEAMEFLYHKRLWIQRQLRRLSAQIIPPSEWTDGTVLLFHGKEVVLQTEEKNGNCEVILGDQRIYPTNFSDNLRPVVEEHLQKMAIKELSARTSELAEKHGLKVKRITVRNQSSRWGSCSERGSISLNWRLIQAPHDVRDYVILHELMHLKEMNHSSRFWKLLEDVCPNYQKKERWLKMNAARLGL
ncbi:MAG: SprT family zinc-dependent metalloprotease [Verrucomicrobiota bacterium]